MDQAVKANTLGNRVKGQVLNMADAERIYSRATRLDPWQGSWPPEDTGSSGLAACKAAIEQGIVERYEWIFAGVDQVLAALAKKPVGVGTWWTQAMFTPDPETLLVEPTGRKAGGHQWTIIGWSPYYDAFEGLCWWGREFGDRGIFRIRKKHLADLLADDGDAHVSHRRH